MMIAETGGLNIVVKRVSNLIGIFMAVLFRCREDAGTSLSCDQKMLGPVSNKEDLVTPKLKLLKHNLI